MAYPAFIDAEVVETESDNLIQFPDNPVNPSRQPDNVSRQPAGQPDYSSADLADTAGVSRQSWIKDWLPHLGKVVPLDALKNGRRYTTLCSELNLSLLAARRSGQSSSAWVAAASAHRPGQSVADRAAVVAQASDLAIVPAVVGQALSLQSHAIGQAQGLADLAGALLDRTVQLISADRQQLIEGDASIADALIIAQETSRILHEEQLKAQVRAQFESKRLAAQSQQLQQDLGQLQGGQHA
jgi:hypothetical protein